VALLREHPAANEKDLEQVAFALETLGKASTKKDFNYGPAEELYRELAQRSGKADGQLKYAGFLGRRGRVRDALDACERAREQGSPEQVGATAVAVLRAGRPDDADYRRVEGWLREGAEKGKNASTFLALLAELHDLRGDYRQAIADNVEALRQAPNNVVVLNNLAWLLALKEGGKGDEAQRLIDRAVDVAGPLPALLDTRGMVLLASGKARQAVADLEQAVAARPTTPEGYFRLARALHADQRAGAVVVFQQAQRRGLRAENLHPLERDEYQRLRTTFTK
jgi:tetratricopeptide (TPR) repeat protein